MKFIVVTDDMMIFIVSNLNSKVRWMSYTIRLRYVEMVGLHVSVYVDWRHEVKRNHHEKHKLNGMSMNGIERTTAINEDIAVENSDENREWPLQILAKTFRVELSVSPGNELEAVVDHLEAVEFEREEFCKTQAEFSNFSQANL
ncbi:Protein CBG20450 [Caenorhabditis briggsae]|uniref:Protein CBG20450 n=1 Tax=Caenorhabditis briggsae TaxID=6238 RepID=A8XXT7_CAEBR|nr:Protein CBG20450 [Caenorhabditis briggsae]CAP37456.2 Protein CBG20450 [Caenorhabditis briggsae]